MVETLEEGALRAFLEKKKSNKRLVIDHEGLVFRTLSFLEKIAASCGIGKATFKNVVQYIANNIELIENDDVAVQFIIRLAEFNAKAATWNKIPPSLLNSLDPFKAIQKAIEEENLPLLELLFSGIDIEISDSFQETALHKACRLGLFTIAHFLLKKNAIVHAVSFHGETPLHLACYTTKIPLVRLLVEKGAHIDCKDNKGKTALIIACEKQDADLTKFLLESKATPSLRDHRGKTALHYASELTSPKIVEILLRYGADVTLKDELGEIPLHKACEKNNKEIVELLLSKRSDLYFSLPNRFGKTAYQYASERGWEGIAQLLLKKTKTPSESENILKQKRIEKSPLHTAFHAGDAKLLEELLMQGENINAKDSFGETVLHLACEKKDLAILQMLLAKGANPNIRDKFGKIPLHEAYEKGASEMVSLFIKNPDIDVNKRDSFGNTLLHKACEKKDLEMVRILLAKGAQVDIANEMELTPLLIACDQDDTEVAKLLLEKGANPQVKNAFGRTPLDIAEAHENETMKKLLQT